MTGTSSRIAWAEQIKQRVSAEFDRVAKALTTAAGDRRPQVQTDTRAVIVILEEKRAEVLAKNEPGYFIRDWQELSDQVRAIKARKAARGDEARIRSSPPGQNKI